MQIKTSLRNHLTQSGIKKPHVWGLSSQGAPHMPELVPAISNLVSCFLGGAADSGLLIPKGQLMKSPSQPLAGWPCGQAGEEPFAQARADVTSGKQSAWGWDGPFLPIVPQPALLVPQKGWGMGRRGRTVPSPCCLRINLTLSPHTSDYEHRIRVQVVL